MRLLSLLSLILSLSSARDIPFLQQFEQMAKVSYGEQFEAQNTEFITSPSFKPYVQQMNQKKPYSFENGDKTKSVDGLDYEKLFSLLKSLSKESNSTLPSYHALLLTRLSYGFANQNFNEAYGKYFANSLSNVKLCEGFFWEGNIFKNEKAMWIESAKSFSQALANCKEDTYYHKSSKMEYARMKYLNSIKK